MNRTVLFLSLAGGLALTALVLGLPQLGQPPKPPAPVVVVAPPVPPVPPQPVTATPGSLSMTSRLSHPYIPQGASEVFATVDLTGAEVPGAKRSPVNLALREAQPRQPGAGHRPLGLHERLQAGPGEAGGAAPGGAAA